MLRLAVLITVVGLLLIAPAARGEAEPVNTCVDCHGDLLEEAGGDIHRAAGFSCVDCHRGNPRAEDPEKSMSPALGFVGSPKAMAAANLCARCHSDIERMRVVNPRLTTDQLAQYRTSEHGKLAAQGNDRVATCVSCHGAHGVRGVDDPASPAHKGNIVATCAGCHNAEYMKGFPIPTDQLEKYTRSVHGRRRLEERDLAAPACNDCHGNHGAAPPGVFAVTHVCGRCHVTQAELFESSSHGSHFRDLGAPPCTTCHNHHEIHETSDEMLGTGERGTCSACHSPGDRCDQATAKMREGLDRLSSETALARELLGRAERVGMDVDRPAYELAGAEDALVRARVEVHAFSEEQFIAVVGDGATVASGVQGEARSKLEEFQFRRRGLAVASVFLLLFAGLLGLRAHRLEQRRLLEEP